MQSNDFKKSPRDLDKVKQDEQEEEFQKSFKNLLKSKNDSNERLSTRKLERQVIQYQSKQQIADGDEGEISKLQQENPEVFDQLSVKMKWGSIQKDPARASKRFHQTLSPWHLVNNMPDRHNKHILNDKILEMDKQSCRHILEMMIEQKKKDDQKKALQSQDREKLRNTLRDKHNQTIQFEASYGVKPSQFAIALANTQTELKYQSINNKQTQQNSLVKYENQEKLEIVDNNEQKRTRGFQQTSVISDVSFANKSKFIVNSNQIKSGNKSNQVSSQDITGRNQSKEQLGTNKLEQQVIFSDQIGNQTLSVWDQGQLQQEQNSPLKKDQQQEEENQQQTKNGSINNQLMLKYNGGGSKQKTMKQTSPHLEALSTAKPLYNSKDLFMSSDFRGLFLADHQEIIQGGKAFEQVMDLNQQVVSKFKQLNQFNKELQTSNNLRNFYKNDLKKLIESKVTSNSNNGRQFNYSTIVPYRNQLSFSKDQISANNQYQEEKNINKSFKFEKINGADDLNIRRVQQKQFEISKQYFDKKHNILDELQQQQQQENIRSLSVTNTYRRKQASGGVVPNSINQVVGSSIINKNAQVTETNRINNQSLINQLSNRSAREGPIFSSQEKSAYTSTLLVPPHSYNINNPIISKGVSNYGRNNEDQVRIFRGNKLVQQLEPLKNKSVIKYNNSSSIEQIKYNMSLNENERSLNDLDYFEEQNVKNKIKKNGYPKCDLVSIKQNYHQKQSIQKA